MGLLIRDVLFDLRLVALFLRRPWPISKAFSIAMVAGIAAPVLNRLFYNLFDWTTAPYAFFPSLALLIGSLYWLVDRSQFRRDWKAMVVTFAAGLVWTCGIVASAWCLSAHVCIAGHLDHPPYPMWHYAADVGWALALALAAIGMWSVRVSLCLAFALLSTFVISYRFLFGSLGGMYVWLPL